MAATAAKKTAAKKPAGPELPEPVELTFDLERDTKGTYVWSEQEAEDGSTIIGKLYVRKFYMNGYVPTDANTLTVTIQVN